MFLQARACMENAIRTLILFAFPGNGTRTLLMSRNNRPEPPFWWFSLIAHEQRKDPFLHSRSKLQQAERPNDSSFSWDIVESENHARLSSTQRRRSL